MEQLFKILKNASSFIEILQNASCESVSNWDGKALSRAYDWAKYFEQIHMKLESKPIFVERLDKQLRLMRRKHGYALGSVDVNFELFRKSKIVLLQCLLQNPHLGKHLYHEVVKLYQQLPQTDESLPERFLCDAAKCSHNKAAVAILSQIRDKLSQKESKPTGSCETSQDVFIKTEALMLSRYLSRIHHEQHNSVIDKLDTLVANSNGLEILVTILILPREDIGKDGIEMDHFNQLVLSYLLEKHADDIRSDTTNLTVWRMSCKLLSQVAASYFTFFKAYTAHLINWGNNMALEYDMTTESTYHWRHKTHQDNLSWNRLQESFSCLMHGPAFVKDAVRRSLQMLAESGLPQESMQTRRHLWAEMFKLMDEEGCKR